MESNGGINTKVHRDPSNKEEIAMQKSVEKEREKGQDIRYRRDGPLDPHYVS